MGETSGAAVLSTSMPDEPIHAGVSKKHRTKIPFRRPLALPGEGTKPGRAVRRGAKRVMLPERERD